MKPERIEDWKVETDTKIEAFSDGSSVMVISTFKDGKNVGITMYVNHRRKNHDSKRVL